MSLLYSLGNWWGWSLTSLSFHSIGNMNTTSWGRSRSLPFPIAPSPSFEKSILARKQESSLFSLGSSLQVAMVAVLLLARRLDWKLRSWWGRELQMGGEMSQFEIWWLMLHAQLSPAGPWSLRNLLSYLTWAVTEKVRDEGEKERD